MARRLLFSALVLVSAGLSSCTHPGWPALARDAAILARIRHEGGQTAAGNAKVERLNDWAYRVQLDTETVYVRCGYHHGTTCCWPVEDEEAATATFGRSQHQRGGQVCDSL